MANVAVTNVEQANLIPYGQRVSLPVGDINVFRTGGPGPTMVLLSGYGTAAPAIDFAPLIRELDGFDVIVIEAFGYGYSALDVPNRTVENITAATHQVLGRLGVYEPVILFGHSVGGIYAATTRTGDRLDALAGYELEHRNPAGQRLCAGLGGARSDLRPFVGDGQVAVVPFRHGRDSLTSWLERHEAELTYVTTHQLQIVEGAHYLHWTQSPDLGRAMSDSIATHVAPNPTKR